MVIRSAFSYCDHLYILVSGIYLHHSRRPRTWLRFKKIGENILNEFLQKLLTQLVTGHRVIDYGRVGSGLGSKLYTRCG